MAVVKLTVSRSSIILAMKYHQAALVTCYEADSIIVLYCYGV